MGDQHGSRRRLVAGHEPAVELVDRGFLPAQLAARREARPEASLHGGDRGEVHLIDGNRPRAMEVSPDGSKVYVAIFESGNSSTIIGSGISANRRLLFQLIEARQAKLHFLAAWNEIQLVPARFGRGGATGEAENPG